MTRVVGAEAYHLPSLATRHREDPRGGGEVKSVSGHKAMVETRERAFVGW